MTSDSHNWSGRSAWNWRRTIQQAEGLIGLRRSAHCLASPDALQAAWRIKRSIVQRGTSKRHSCCKSVCCEPEDAGSPHRRIVCRDPNAGSLISRPGVARLPFPPLGLPSDDPGGDASTKLLPACCTDQVPRAGRSTGRNLQAAAHLSSRVVFATVLDYRVSLDDSLAKYSAALLKNHVPYRSGQLALEAV